MSLDGRLFYQDAKDLLMYTRLRTNMSPAILEKDFWICWTLDFLFGRSKWKDQYYFKGGTSLSKVYGLINRFSEDIDLVLDWSVLGINPMEPWKERSRNQQNLYIGKINKETAGFIHEQMLPEFSAYVEEQLGLRGLVLIDQNEPQVLCFNYPCSFGKVRSILQQIRLEIGLFAETDPLKTAKVHAYVEQFAPKLDDGVIVPIRAIAPERTLWEKISILNRETFRDESRLRPKRYSRHYYDVFMLSHTSVLDDALKQMDILKKVQTYRDHFYHCGWYDPMKVLTKEFELLPQAFLLEHFAQDYQLTKDMYLENRPSFEEILGRVEEVRDLIRQRL